MGLLSDEEWDIICAVEKHYLASGKFPPLSKIAVLTEIDQVKIVDALSRPLVKQALDNRGIEWRPVKSTELKPEQYIAIEVMLNISDQRSNKDKLASLGIKPATYNSWKRNEVFMDAYRQAARDLYGKSIPELHTAVIKRAIDGDAAMMKTALAISGEWDDKRSVEALNVQFVLMKVLEVIQKHIQDPVVLSSIAGEFDQVLNPGTRKALE